MKSFFSSLTHHFFSAAIWWQRLPADISRIHYTPIPFPESLQRRNISVKVQSKRHYQPEWPWWRADNASFIITIPFIANQCFLQYFFLSMNKIYMWNPSVRWRSLSSSFDIFPLSYVFDFKISSYLRIKYKKTECHLNSWKKKTSLLSPIMIIKHKYYFY